MSDGMVQQLADKLHIAYTNAGDEMGKKMAAAVVAIVAEATTGQGQPAVFGWELKKAPEQVKALIPKDNGLNGFCSGWVFIVHPKAGACFLEDKAFWSMELPSGHHLFLTKWK